MDFPAGVWAGTSVVMGGMGQLCFLDCLAGCGSGRPDAGGTTMPTLVSMFIASESEDRFELLPKDGAHLSDLEVTGTTTDLECFIIWTRGLCGYSDAGLDELYSKEKEQRSPGCFTIAQFEKRDKFSVEELGVEGLSDDSWLLEDFPGDGDGRAYG